MNRPQPDEVVTLNGVGSYTVRTMVRKLAAAELPAFAHYDLFRDHGRQPPVYELTTVEAKQLASLPEYLGDR